MKHVGCKHLDYTEDKFLNCKLCTIEPEGWKYWERMVVPYEGAPVKVQFCKLKGRINEIFACINKDEMMCYEEQ